MGAQWEAWDHQYSGPGSRGNWSGIAIIIWAIGSVFISEIITAENGILVIIGLLAMCDIIVGIADDLEKAWKKRKSTR